jgi:hypothetical protein
MLKPKTPPTRRDLLKRCMRCRVLGTPLFFLKQAQVELLKVRRRRVKRRVSQSWVVELFERNGNWEGCYARCGFTKALEAKPGDIVEGPSMSEDTVRRWKILAVSGDMAIGQNVAAKKHFRHPLDLHKVRPVEAQA